MMPGLAMRDPHATELMDDPDCDRELLMRTYALFPLVNAVVGGWRGVYLRDIRPRARRGVLRIVDIGCGGADVARTLLRWAHRDGLTLDVVGIDTDPRAIAWAKQQEPTPGLTLRTIGSAELVAAGERFDAVISNHLLHHLRPPELLTLLHDSSQLVDRGGVVLHRDIARGRLAYACFAVATAPLPSTHRRRSFIRTDGLTSIRRSYTRRELADAAPPGWTARRDFPSRLELRLEPAGD